MHFGRTSLAFVRSPRVRGQAEARRPARLPKRGLPSLGQLIANDALTPLLGG